MEITWQNNEKDLISQVLTVLVYTVAQKTVPMFGHIV